MKNKYLKFVVYVVVAFAVMMLLDYLFFPAEMNWKSNLMFSFTLTVLEFVCEIFSNKKSEK